MTLATGTRLYSVAIQAHPKRKAFIPYLHKHLGEVPVAWDERGSVWDTWKRAAQLAYPGSEFHLVIQDDALIGRRFHQRLERELARGFDAYCLFFRFKGRRTHDHMNQLARDGRASGGFAWRKMQFAVGTAIRTSLLPALIEFCDSDDDWPSGDDPRITKFVRDQGIDVWYPLPSLVNHRVGQSVLSIDRPQTRRATWFE